MVLDLGMFLRPQDQKTVAFLLLAWGEPQFLANNELINMSYNNGFSNLTSFFYVFSILFTDYFIKHCKQF